MTALPQQPPGRLLAGAEQIEIHTESLVRGRVRFALFDFDGTVSLIRTGWQDVMIPMMVDILAATPKAEDRETLDGVVRDYVDTLTGKQTIYQMLRLADEVRRRGGTPRDPLDYKHQYLDLLWDKVRHRVAGLKDGRIAPDELLVPGCVALLENLRARGITCYLASGTDEPYVIDEARALRVDECFDGGIYGALDDYRKFSKQMIIDRIFAEHGLGGPELVAFGDGYVEIENTVAVGGIAIGAATDEVTRCGVNAWKRNRLILAGAHMIVPDFREQTRLLSWLCAEE
ncbi:MAG: HAD family hydrolase [Armatimonadetes bacterium]|nr:HAD family hydrolase [Armatimonadota bacterium]